MRIFLRPLAKTGDTRVVRRFLWFPKSIGRELRWLEWVSFEEKYQWWGDCGEWRATHWEEENVSANVV